MTTPNAQQMSASDFNLHRITTAELERQVAASIRLESSIAIFGRRGTGKTHICKQKIKEAGYHEVYMNLSVFERVDIGGYPDMLSPSRKDEFINYILPAFYRLMMTGDKKVVLLLDEVDKADTSLQAPLLELVQFHTINGRKLPNLSMCIMTGNLISEGGNRPSLPLMDRAEAFLVQGNSQEWLDWAGKVGGIHPSITSFIHDNPKELFGPDDPDDRYKDPSPRGWHNASEILRKGELHNLDADLLQDKVIACIGKTAGLKYINYYRHYRELLPMIDALFKGQDVSQDYRRLEVTKKLVTIMIACARLASLLDATNDATLNDVEKLKAKTVCDEAVTNIGKFIAVKDLVPDEQILIAVRSQLTLERLMNFDLDTNPIWEPTFDRLNNKMSGKKTP